MSSSISLQEMLAGSFLSGGNVAYIDALYEAFLNESSSVPKEWREYFSHLPQVNGATHEVSHAAIVENLRQAAYSKRVVSVQVPTDTVVASKQAHVTALIQAYRSYGHYHAQLDPLNMAQRLPMPELTLNYHHLNDTDLATVFQAESLFPQGSASLKEIFETLQKTYCGTFTAEYMYLSSSEQRQWLQTQIESVQGHPRYEPATQKRILQCLVAADGLEKYLGSKFVGQKRFSLEGGGSLIPMLDKMFGEAAQSGVKEIVVGMAHRGRLNVLVNLLGKSPKDLFEEFEGKHKDETISGDVKYHKGFSSDITTPQGELHLALAFNPSHLEIINPVVEGAVRARQHMRADNERAQVIPVLIHGDAAFTGQGVVMETFNFSQARGFSTGGTVHIVINNQIGFTTSQPNDARSTPYCTDVAKMVQVPVFHVNGDDPEAVIFAATLALAFRQRFHQDVVIDLVCYRRHGHNEADDASITQPLMYEKIRQHPITYEVYAKRLVEQGVIASQDLDKLVSEYRDALDAGKPLVNVKENGLNWTLAANWKPYLQQTWDKHVDTRVDQQRLQTLATRLDKLPEGFIVHPQVEKVFAERREMAAGKVPFNWGAAEVLAYASLVEEGYVVRLTGQDCGRGTFAHRHAIVYDYKTGKAHIPLNTLAQAPMNFTIFDSVLSEEAVVGFEYGFATAEPRSLILWEAQFGDFANGAQVLFDQFISSGEQKWGRLCGLVLLLPHGYEGQGPEHSSARLERYLQLCAQENMQVCVPTTPAQCFHMLRRQALRPYRKPLIVMTPKSLLRHKLAVSSLEELTKGQFQTVIPEIDDINASKVNRVIFCAGKVYYDLLQKRRQENMKDVAIIRIEQLYPFPEKALTDILKVYKNAEAFVWCQEEPENQGAWVAVQPFIVRCLGRGQSLRYAGRPAAASPAVGALKVHNEEQARLVTEAFQ